MVWSTSATGRSVADAHLLGEDLLPTPFTADEIREGCPEGRTIRLRVEPATGAAYERVNRFVDCDAEGATIESWVVGDRGQQVGPAANRQTWLELQRHAAFPVEGTTVSEEPLELPFGRFVCRVYARAGGARFLFARDLPGMPVRYEIPDGEGGVAVTEMVADER
jgi:hypothetical protein